MKTPYDEIKQIELEHLRNVQDLSILLTALDIEHSLTGKYIKMDCPQCQKRNKVSVSRYEATGFYTWRCWNTGCNVHQKVGGNLIGLLKAEKQCDHVGALEQIKSALLLT